MAMDQKRSEETFAVVSDFLTGYLTSEQLFADSLKEGLATISTGLSELSGKLVQAAKSKLPTLKKILQDFSLSEKLALVTELAALAAKQAGQAFASFWAAAVTRSMAAVQALADQIKRAAAEIVARLIANHYVQQIKAAAVELAQRASAEGEALAQQAIQRPEHYLLSHHF